MRAVGTCKRMLDMACERALSRETQGELLANKQMTQEKIADCWTMLEEFSEPSDGLPQPSHHVVF